MCVCVCVCARVCALYYLRELATFHVLAALVTGVLGVVLFTRAKAECSPGRIIYEGDPYAAWERQAHSGRHESQLSVCLWSTPSAESEPQHVDRIMCAKCPPSHAPVKSGRLYIHVLFHTLRHGGWGGGGNC